MTREGTAVEKIGKLKITTETIKVLTDNELRGIRGGLGSAGCCSTTDPTMTDTVAGCITAGCIAEK
jgi:hypothetical protein